MKRSWIKRRSGHNVDRAAEAKPVRDALKLEQGKCMICGIGPGSKSHAIAAQNQLCCHEILNGPLRQKTLDEPCSILVLCYHCNQNEVEDKGKWPVPRQLAVLLRHAPQHYDLVRFNWLRNPNAPLYVEQHEVDYWYDKDNGHYD